MVMRDRHDPAVIARLIEILERPGSAATPEQVAALRAMMPDVPEHTEPDYDDTPHEWWTMSDVEFKTGRSDNWLYKRVKRGVIRSQRMLVGRRHRVVYWADDVIREHQLSERMEEQRVRYAYPTRRVPEHLWKAFTMFVAGVAEAMNERRRAEWIKQKREEKRCETA